MSLIEKRIEALNIENEKKIRLVIEDVFSDELNKGTKVTLRIPL